MNLVLKLDLDIVKMYVCTENEVPTFSGWKDIDWTNTQTNIQADTQSDTTEITYRHSRMVKNNQETKKISTSSTIRTNTWMNLQSQINRLLTR